MIGILKNGARCELPFCETEQENYKSVTLSMNEEFQNLASVEIDVLGNIATENEEGYLVLPRGRGCDDYALHYFNRHTEDFCEEITRCNMPFFGVKTKEQTVLCMITGLSWEFVLRVERKAGIYRVYPVFYVDGKAPCEDIKLEYFFLETGADYCDMARMYRNIRLERKEIVPICEREKQSPTLTYSADSVLLRIRCGWKPAPAQVHHQTLENEPEMHVACTFQRIGDLLDELSAQGVEKAELCLVGWNVKGHDGRWPQAFPVCEELGGEAALRALIKKAQAMGYQIVCHTNHTDQYEIADCYSAEHTRIKKDGEIGASSMAWSGGQMYELCPKIGKEQADVLLPQVADLGFRGTHYIDVLNNVPPCECYHKDHPVTTKEAVGYALDMAKNTKALFGGMSSEGAYDFLVPELDFSLYVSYANGAVGLVDEQIPFWQLVYHGTTLSNPYTKTVNAEIKTEQERLKLIEYGGRPAFYYYSAFMSDGNNWMGAKDMLFDDEEQLKDSVAKVKESYDRYQKRSYLQRHFMERHENLGNNCYRVTYSDGTVITVDYENETYEIKNPATTR